MHRAHFTNHMIEPVASFHHSVRQVNATFRSTAPEGGIDRTAFASISTILPSVLDGPRRTIRSIVNFPQLGISRSTGKAELSERVRTDDLYTDRQ